MPKNVWELNGLVGFYFWNQQGMDRLLVVTVSFLSPHGVRNVCVELFWWQWMYLSVLVVICVCFSGPCGGKTTGQARLSSFFESMNWKVRHIEIRVHSNHPFIIIIRHWCDCPARMSNVWLCKKKSLLYSTYQRKSLLYAYKVYQIAAQKENR